ncbi:Hypothetical predicted protein [Pelobates cultripes]|uniref:Uncharacterized protein n=1 Tax=Pelobates cultripes TaxID=61616 RepID=A0AAD1SZ00_PELCU|nr:Hypothetical predicted protein [Pelobates cultripes]
MGKKNKHLGAVKPTAAQDIGDLFLQPAKASSLNVPKQHGDTASASSEEQAMDELDEFPHSGGLHHPSSDEDNELPSTKGDIKALLCHIRNCLQQTSPRCEKKYTAWKNESSLWRKTRRVSLHDTRSWKPTTQNCSAPSLSLTAA